MSTGRIVPFLLFLASAGLLVLGLVTTGTATSGPPLATDQGHDVPQAGCLLVNGWDVCNYGDATLKDVYLRDQTYLGDPISGFDSQAQWFRFGRLTYNPANPADLQVQFDNLGLKLLQITGRTPDPGAELAPAVRDWLVAIQEVGIDPLVIAGRTISPPICDQHTGTCEQYLDKIVFRFPQDATTASQVTRLPLGTLLRHPEAATPTAAPTHALVARSTFFTLAALFGLVAVGWFLVGRRGTTVRPTTI